MKPRTHDKAGDARSDGRLLFAYLAALAVVGMVTVGRIGVTWDEPNYFGSTYLYYSWFAHVFEQPGDWWASIDRFWTQSHEAPPFFKLWAGVFAGAGALLFGADDLRAVGNAYRLGSYALFLLSTFAAFRFAYGRFGRAAAWGVAVTMPLIPVLYGFARLGQLDGAAASMYLLAALALFRVLDRAGEPGEGRRVLWAGLLFGLAFATKLTVFPLVPAALAWVFVYRRSALPGALARLVGVFGVGVVVFYGIWPWLWRDPVGRTWEFLTWARGLEDERFTYFLGQWWAGAPFHYPLATLFVLVPLAVAVAGVIGALRLLRRGDPASGWVMIHLSAIVAAAGSGLVPVYGGPRQFLDAFPLWAICAGVGVGWLAQRLAARSGRRRILPAVLALYAGLSLPGILWTGAGNSLEYYGEGVGLIPGAKALGFETTYLSNTYRPAVRWLNENAPEGATVYVQGGTFPVIEAYRRIGEMRRDLRPAYLAPIAEARFTRDEEPREDSFFLFLPRQSIHTDQMLALDRKEPLYTDEKGGVPLVKVFSGRAAGETLSIEGEPGANEPGLLNALGAATVFGVVAFVLARGQEHQGKKRDQEQVAERE